MFLNHRPILVLLLFLAASPVDVVSRIVYSDDVNSGNPDGYPENETLPHHHEVQPLELDLNPLHILCPVCSLLQLLLGGVLGALLGGGIVKQVLIFACSVVLSLPLKIPFLPNIICTVVFEIVFILLNKTKSGLCPLLLLCPLPKKAVKPTKAVFETAEEEYVDRIVNIIENRDSANLSPQMEYFYRDLVDFLPIWTLEGTGIKEPALHAIRNLVAAIEYHSIHRSEYLAALSQKSL